MMVKSNEWEPEATHAGCVGGTFLERHADAAVPCAFPGFAFGSNKVAGDDITKIIASTWKHFARKHHRIEHLILRPQATASK
jgi:hypothetical protein